MLLYLLATFCVASTTAYSVLENSYILSENDDANELSWSEFYTVKATRVSLTSNIEEDFVVCLKVEYNGGLITNGEFYQATGYGKIYVKKTNVSSRVDCNKGAFKIIAKKVFYDDDPDEPKYRFKKIMIHPETTEHELNVIKCHYSRDNLFSSKKELDDILPRVDENKYVAIDNETVGDVTTATKFEFTDYDEDYKLDIKKTLWATYSEDFGWIPLKLEDKEYNGILESLIKHDVWTYFDYYPDVDDEEVFYPEKNGCEEPTATEHTAESEKVTKELYFIDPENKHHVNHVFTHFKNKYNRQYNEENEHALRKAIFKENMRLITSVNRRNLTYKLGINEFADWTPEEKQMMRGVISQPLKGVENHATTIPFLYGENELQNELDKLPKEYDMRVLGLISPVKNQDQCGSCWTFAAAAVMEGALARVNGGRVISLSNQAIIDCAYDGLGDKGAGGCQGGFDYVAYNFIEKHGLPTDYEYGPYKMRDGYCNIGNMTKLYSIYGYTPVTKYSANAMRVAMVNNGPLYVYVHGSDEFSLYSSGIFYQNSEICDPEMPTHAVALVGYGDIDGESFFILKNSYGAYWGDDGYMLISARDNVCGVQSNPSYPVIRI